MLEKLKGLLPFLPNRKTFDAPSTTLKELPTDEKFAAFPSIQKLANLYDKKLLLRTEIHLTDRVFNKLVLHDFFRDVPAIMKKHLQTTCRRCNNQASHLFATIDCRMCHHSHLYCRNCIQMGRIMECEPLYYWSGPAFQWPKVANACTWQGRLAETQREAAKEIMNKVQTGGSLLTWAVTGSGKTEMLFPGITEALRLGKRVCIASPRTDVVRELYPRIQAAFQKVPIQALYGGSRDKDGTAQIIISTTHQLFRYRHAFDVLIIDEIDAFPYHQDAALQFAAKEAVKQEHTKIYLTATPRKQHQILIKQKRLEHVFVPIRFHKQPLIVPQLKYCSNLTKQLTENKLPNALRTWLTNREKPTRQLLLFLPTIALTNQLHDSIAGMLVDLEVVEREAEVTAVHAEDDARPEKIQLFRDQKLKCLLTTTILERGVTFPAIDVGVIQADHLVFDEAALVQIAGRVGRSVDDPKGELVFFHQGKTDGMVEAIDSIEHMNALRLKYIRNFKKGD